MIKTTISNPLIKIGYAVLADLAGESELVTDIETDKLDIATSYIEDKYTRPGAWRNFLAGVVFPNSGFAQYAYDKPHLEHKKYEYAETVLRSYREDTPVLEGQNCVFCGRAAVFIATREHIPLLNAQGYGNFGGLGQAGLPVCGTCLLAAHALPLGCQIVSGRLLAVSSDNDDITFSFARTALEQMQAVLQLEGLEKMPGKRFVRTRLIEALTEAQRRGERLRSLRGKNSSLTGYLFTNSGQNAEIGIFELPSDVVDFLITIKRQDQAVQRAWNQAIARGWGAQKDDIEEETNRKNDLYEDLFTLPDRAFSFLRKHILPTRSWELIRFFLHKVMHMDPQTIDLLNELGSRFAAYSQDKSGFFFDFMREQNYTKWRQRLVEASYDSTKRYNRPLITSEEFLRAFTKPRDADKYWSWKLPRDIVTLRILEEKVKAGEELPEVDGPIFDQAVEDEET
jgi:CRISPR-associated protein Cst1